MFSVLLKGFSRPSVLSGSLSTTHFEEHLAVDFSALLVDQLTLQLRSTQTIARSPLKDSKISRYLSHLYIFYS
jgi:hypothetical protein